MIETNSRRCTSGKVFHLPSRNILLSRCFEWTLMWFFFKVGFAALWCWSNPSHINRWEWDCFPWRPLNYRDKSCILALFLSSNFTAPVSLLQPSSFLVYSSTVLCSVGRSWKRHTLFYTNCENMDIAGVCGHNDTALHALAYCNDAGSVDVVICWPCDTATLSNVNYNNYRHGDVAKIRCYMRNV